MAEAAAPGPAADRGVWSWLAAGEWRAHRMRVLLAILSIAVGVALAFAVHLINRSAVESFGNAVRSVSGEAEMQVRGTTGRGLDEALYPALMALPEIADVSPVIERRGAEVAGVRMTLLGLDVLRAASVSPVLVGVPEAEERAPGMGRAVDLGALLSGDALYLSAAAVRRSGLRLGDPVLVRAGGSQHVFRLSGTLPGIGGDQNLAVIDIAAAQWRFGTLGRIDRLDLRRADDVPTAGARAAVQEALPADARLTGAEAESRRGADISRAYRVNLGMLAFVALITGGFLVYSAQALSVTRRQRQFALLRTLGMQAESLRRQLLLEGVVLGLAGAAIGLAGGYALARAALSMFGGDLGAGYFDGRAAALSVNPLAALAFFAFSMGVAVAGSYVPARRAARIAPAQALKTEGDPIDPRRRPPWRPALLCGVLGAGAAFLPPVAGLPVFGYVSAALILAAGVMAMPWLARRLLSPLARVSTGAPPIDLALLRLYGAPSQAAIALAGIVSSTALMIAMVIMVTSFRGAVDEWLGTFLAADLYVGGTEGTAPFGPELQEIVAATPGIAELSFSRTLDLVLDPDRAPVELIVRPVEGAPFPIRLTEAAAGPGEGIPVWISEPAARLYGLSPGDLLALPVGVEPAAAHVAGIWQDYARQGGALVMESADYVALTGDEARDLASITLAPGTEIAEVRAHIEARMPAGLPLQFAEPAVIRAEALALFDRSFAVTYALEAVAIAIGIAGVAATMSAQTVQRRKEFGMLRHIGMTRRQITVMLAGEGALVGLVGGVAGGLLGLALSQLLIHVINPQSFNFTMTTRLSPLLLPGVTLALVAAAALTAVFAGRAATSGDALRAVREDW